MSRVASDEISLGVNLAPLSKTTVRRDCPLMTCSLVSM